MQRCVQHDTPGFTGIAVVSFPLAITDHDEGYGKKTGNPKEGRRDSVRLVSRKTGVASGLTPLPGAVPGYCAHAHL